jgi:hypothetical protein
LTRVLLKDKQNLVLLGITEGELVILEDDIVIENGCQVVNFLHNIMVSMVTFISLTVAIIALNAVVWIAVVGETIYFLVLRIR